MNDTHQVLAFADDVNLIGDDIRTTERNTNVLLNACKDISLAVHTRKTKYMETGSHRDMNANEHIRIGSNSCEKLRSFEYLRSLVTNRSSIQDEIQCRLKSVNSCYYYSVQTLLHSRLLSKKLKIKIYKTIIIFLNQIDK